MLRNLVALTVAAALAAPAAAVAADTPLSGLTADSGDLLATGSIIIATGPPVAQLEGTAFAPLPAATGDVLDLGTDATGAPVLVRAKCAGGVPLCITPLAAATPVKRIAPIDPRHCETTGAAIDHGRIALAVVARKGKPGTRCHAGIYSGGKLRAAVKRWRIGNPVELLRVRVSLDLHGTTALVRIDQDSWDVGEASDDWQQLRTVSLTTGRSRTIATNAAVENGADGEVLTDTTIGPAGVTAVGQCRELDGPTAREVLRWPTTGGKAQALTSPPFPEPAAVAQGTQGLVLRALDGTAVLRDAPAFGPRPNPMSANCRFT